MTFIRGPTIDVRNEAFVYCHRSRKVVFGQSMVSGEETNIKPDTLLRPIAHGKSKSQLKLKAMFDYPEGAYIGHLKFIG